MLAAHHLAVTLAGLPCLHCEGHAYRVVAYKYLAAPQSPHPHRLLYGLGAPAAGARFTPHGGMATISLAEDLATAFDEANPEQAILRRVDPGLVRPTPPGAHVAVVYRLDSVLDVTDSAIQQALGTNPSELTAPWRLTQHQGHVPPTQQLGQAVFDSGVYQAIRYESARVPGTACLAIFPDRLVAPAFMEVYDPDGNICERLP
jgi:RES domain-containing protein